MMDMKKGEAAMVRIHGAEKLPRVNSYRARSEV